MKKKYKKPSIEIYNVKVSSIICASVGGPGAGGHLAKQNDDYYFLPFEEEYDNIYGNIFGE